MKVDKKLEKRLYGLGEVDPPEGLVRRVMAKVAEEDLPSATAASSADGPAMLPPRQVAMVLVAAVVLAGFMLPRSIPEVTDFLRSVGDVLLLAVKAGTELCTVAAAFVVSSLEKTIVVSKIGATVVRTAVRVLAEEAGPLIVVAVGSAIGLQLLLWTMMGRRGSS